ncbi:MAG: GAF domain-containing protein [Chloroflexi bacterium]|nr:GAF domain-containing protein [Chloroflexota bacterium]
MKNSFFQLPESTSQQARSAFLTAVLIAAAHFVAVFYYLFLAPTATTWQFYVLAGVSFVLGLWFVFGAVLSWRGQASLSIVLVLAALALSYPLIATLATGLGVVLGSALMVVGPMSAFQILPRRSGWVAAVLTAVSGLATLLVDMFGSGAGPSLPNAFVHFLATSTVVVIVIVLFRQFRDYSLRTKLITFFTFATLIGVGIVGIGSYISYRNQVREDIRERLIHVVSIIALNQDGDLHATIQTVEDQQSDAYKKMQAANAAILATDPDLTYIFSVRVDEQGKLTFVLDNGLEEGYVPLIPGVVYDDPSALLAENALTLDRPIVEEDFYTDEYGTFLSAYAPIYRKDGTREGIVGVDINATTVIAMERAARNQIILFTMAALLLTAAVGFYLGNLFTKPITQLSAVAQKVAEGDLSARANIGTADEVGALAHTFNAMTSRLQATLGNLEARVAERTRNLELAAEVGRTVSQVRALDVMLKDAAELIRKQFDLYYVQVYLADPSQTNLVLQSGTGSVGEQLISRRHRLPLNTGSINGRAAVEKHSVVISDTAASATFKPNPLLLNTRSEMAVPLLIGDQVVGVLDMQSEHAGSLSQDVLPAFEALAGQLAIAIQNANLLAETEQARAEVESQARRLVRKGWQEYQDAIHQPERSGFVFEGGKIVPYVEAGELQPLPEGNAISAPISVTGEPLGSLVVEVNERDLNAQTAELVNIVARQVAQQIENLRLLESAERYRLEAEGAVRRLTLEGWQRYVENRAGESLGYLYDLNEVRPAWERQPAIRESVTLPLKARDETVGKLAVQGLEADDKDALELANAVAERLGAHIENLRLLEDTKRGQIELDERARQLAAVAEISTASSRELDVQKMLETVVRLTQRKFGLYHAHVFLFNETTGELKIAACGWKEGDEHEGTHGTAVIPLDREQSLVARAARTRQTVVVNDVRDGPGLVAEPGCSPIHKRKWQSRW